MPSGRPPRVAIWVPYITIGVPILVGVILHVLLPAGQPNFWISLLGLIASYFATGRALKWLFNRYGLD